MAVTTEFENHGTSVSRGRSGDPTPVMKFCRGAPSSAVTQAPAPSSSSSAPRCGAEAASVQGEGRSDGSARGKWERSARAGAARERAGHASTLPARPGARCAPRSEGAGSSWSAGPAPAAHPPGGAARRGIRVRSGLGCPPAGSHRAPRGRPGARPCAAGWLRPRGLRAGSRRRSGCCCCCPPCAPPPRSPRPRPGAACTRPTSTWRGRRGSGPPPPAGSRSLGARGCGPSSTASWSAGPPPRAGATPSR